MPRFKYTVEVEVERTQGGKFEAKSELADAIREVLDNANPNEVEGPAHGTTYEVTDWQVTEDDSKEKQRQIRELAAQRRARLAKMEGRKP